MAIISQGIMTDVFACRVFALPSNSCAPPLHCFHTPPTPIPRNHCSFYCFLSFSFSTVSYSGFIQHVAFSHWLLFFSNMHLIFSMSFHALIAHVFLALNTNNCIVKIHYNLFIQIPTEGHPFVSKLWK